MPISYETFVADEVGQYRATPSALAAGFMIEQDVVVPMPDGSKLYTTRVLMTQKGLAHFKALLAEDAR
ncbi:hypothetical protein M0638_12670 [Roseomonas sp. NAR14]|uniref:Uncharacterized protein n=1 Tax=Roseomonas acroporae TaxID=2937791 RepID=A0A9X1Y6S8_9PROT|nr:hypothetical protein [Roseomonas acroporae]MCK8785239.1 hypothetical protein [Roseomonas acroporae]